MWSWSFLWGEWSVLSRPCSISCAQWQRYSRIYKFNYEYYISYFYKMWFWHSQPHSQNSFLSFISEQVFNILSLTNCIMYNISVNAGEHLNPGPPKYKSGVIRLLIIVTLHYPYSLHPSWISRYLIWRWRGWGTTRYLHWTLHDWNSLSEFC